MQRLESISVLKKKLKHERFICFQFYFLNCEFKFFWGQMLYPFCGNFLNI